MGWRRWRRSGWRDGHRMAPICRGRRWFLNMQYHGETRLDYLCLSGWRSVWFHRSSVPRSGRYVLYSVYCMFCIQYTGCIVFSALNCTAYHISCICTTLHCITLHSTTLHYTTLYHRQDDINKILTY